MASFTVTTMQTHTFRSGWGVSVTPLWTGEDEPEAVADVFVAVVEIREDAVRVIGGVPCVRVEDDMWVPVENFRDLPDLTYDDQHDLRDRWFATREEAEAHAVGVRSTWEYPAPWVSFVTLV